MATTSGERPTPDSKPNFTLPNHGVISEENWPEFQAQGFWFWRNQGDASAKGATQELDVAQSRFGSENVVTGASFDEREGRPLEHKPGRAIYVGPGAPEAARMAGEGQYPGGPENIG